ncbi:hypothetical protein ACFW1A_34250, partial [Kitasatospora sp. NPDC058965]|uniref:hypothetical protein n=1 Tax=Kitasatospora sp. NPDC058965 TaxID=3346682 RepID=UPI0036C6D267
MTPRRLGRHLLVTALTGSLALAALTGTSRAASQPGALRVGFGGSFSLGNGYTAATGETLDGSLTRRTGGETITAGSGVQLAGGTQGLSFQPA